MGLINFRELFGITELKERIKEVYAAIDKKAGI